MGKVKIAILGLGNVGSGVWKILNTNKEEISKRSGHDIEVKKILVRDLNKDRGVDVPKKILTDNIDEIINDDSIEIVVELMGGTKAAKDYIMSSIRKGKHVVTANKELISTMGNELFKAAEEEGVMLYYEASVAGGVPIIHSINESLTANKVEEVVGIINGTTNYILTKMTMEGMDFETALKEAQEKGYAEADPTSDVEAYDSVYKLAILASLSFGTRVQVSSIYREGIKHIHPMDIEYAKELGYIIKLLSIVKEKDNGLELRVHPTMIPHNHPLANVNDSYNAILIKGNAVGNLMFYGRGAGDLPTGSAVVADIISILRRNINSNYVNGLMDDSYIMNVMSMDETESQYYIRMMVRDVPGVLGEITTIFGTNGVSMSSVIQKDENYDVVPIVFITHRTTEGNINKSIENIKKLECVSGIESIIRVEDL